MGGTHQLQSQSQTPINSFVISNNWIILCMYISLLCIVNLLLQKQNYGLGEILVMKVKPPLP